MLPPPLAGVVTTLAGNGGGSLVNGTGTNADFRNPQGIDVFPNGNLVVADAFTYSIRLITYPGAVVTTLAGGSGGFLDGTGTNAQFNAPSGVCVLPDGNLVVADKTNNRIRLVTYPGGVVTTLAGNGTASAVNGTGTNATFNEPTGVCVLPDGKIAVCGSDQKIRLITYPGAVVTTLAGSGGVGFQNGTGTSAVFWNPQYMVFIPSTSVIAVTDAGNCRIRLVTYPGGVVTTLAGNGTASTVDGTGTNARFGYPQGIALSPFNTLLVNEQNNYIRTVTYPGGVVTTLAGKGTATFANGTGTNAGFVYPSALVFVQDGKLAMAGNADHRIRLIS